MTREQQRDYQKQWRLAHPGYDAGLAKVYRVKHRDTYLKTHRSQRLKRYGLTIASFNDLLESQRNRCAICMTDKPGGFANQWAVDHNHLTGRTRGILCNNCNKGLGHFRDSILYLVCAKNYLEKYQ